MANRDVNFLEWVLFDRFCKQKNPLEEFLQKPAERLPLGIFIYKIYFKASVSLKQSSQQLVFNTSKKHNFGNLYTALKSIYVLSSVLDCGIAKYS